MIWAFYQQSIFVQFFYRYCRWSTFGKQNKNTYILFQFKNNCTIRNSTFILLSKYNTYQEQKHTYEAISYCNKTILNCITSITNLSKC